jgi:hypothetical protein
VIIGLDSKRRLTIPVALASVASGDRFEARFDAEEGVLTFRRIARKENWLAVLKACPVSPDDVPQRRSIPARRQL